MTYKVENKDPFDTEYVVGLLEKERKLVNSIKDFEAKLEDSGKLLNLSQIELEQTQALITRSEQKFRTCEAEKVGILDNAKRSLQKVQTESSTECSSQTLDLAVANDRITSLEKTLAKERRDLSDIQEELIATTQLLTQAQNSENKELVELKALVNKLNRAVNEPIAIDKHYLTARYCNKPKFDGLICVQEFLVRPTFTKTPITKVVLKILNSEGSTVASGEFTSNQSQLFRLSMGRGKELASGNYVVIYEVDNQLLRSDGVMLNQE
ncbi:hypothetical protein [Glaciecola petra]|uniref:Uncharacterized protein n=1 Tax=Glaciecola petra TaxID=3075602 RepID=A0ABU2ZPL4_9ALTE|nr:hypothetical protein [Aestuariibacter sp. P117]MDT0594570.1 hypothetical protein [Aestuariibacter sp. P117]